MNKTYEDRSLELGPGFVGFPNLRSAALGPALRRPAAPHEPAAIAVDLRRKAERLLVREG